MDRLELVREKITEKCMRFLKVKVETVIDASGYALVVNVHGHTFKNDVQALMDHIYQDFLEIEEISQVDIEKDFFRFIIHFSSDWFKRARQVGLKEIGHKIQDMAQSMEVFQDFFSKNCKRRIRKLKLGSKIQVAESMVIVEREATQILKIRNPETGEIYSKEIVTPFMHCKLVFGDDKDKHVLFEMFTTVDQDEASGELLFRTNFEGEGMDIFIGDGSLEIITKNMTEVVGKFTEIIDEVLKQLHRDINMVSA